jgi:hypothetical protein
MSLFLFLTSWLRSRAGIVEQHNGAMARVLRWLSPGWQQERSSSGSPPLPPIIPPSLGCGMDVRIAVVA